jgi:hypothetical protein
MLIILVKRSTKLLISLKYLVSPKSDVRVDTQLSTLGIRLMNATATCQNGHVYNETFTVDIGNDSENIRAFLTIDGCHLEMQPNGCMLTKPF